MPASSSTTSTSARSALICLAMLAFGDPTDHVAIAESQKLRRWTTLAADRDREPRIALRPLADRYDDGAPVGRDAERSELSPVAQAGDRLECRVVRRRIQECRSFDAERGGVGLLGRPDEIGGRRCRAGERDDPLDGGALELSLPRPPR